MFEETSINSVVVSTTICAVLGRVLFTSRIFISCSKVSLRVMRGGLGLGCQNSGFRKNCCIDLSFLLYYHGKTLSVEGKGTMSNICELTTA